MGIAQSLQIKIGAFNEFHTKFFEQIIQNLVRSSSTRCELSLQHKEILKLIRNDFAEEGDLEEYEIFNVKFLAVKIILLETYDYRDIVLE